jgi:hypothetical protein
LGQSDGRVGRSDGEVGWADGGVGQGQYGSREAYVGGLVPTHTMRPILHVWTSPHRMGMWV